MERSRSSAVLFVVFPNYFAKNINNISDYRLEECLRELKQYLHVKPGLRFTKTFRQQKLFLSLQIKVFFYIRHARVKWNIHNHGHISRKYTQDIYSQRATKPFPKPEFSETHSPGYKSSWCFCFSVSGGKIFKTAKLHFIHRLTP